MLSKSGFEWVNSQMLKSAFGGQLAVYCNRHGDTACMHFMKDYKCVRNFYCSVAEYDRCTKAGSVIEMRDDFNNSIRVRPAGFHNFNSWWRLGGDNPENRRWIFYRPRRYRSLDFITGTE